MWISHTQCNLLFVFLFNFNGLALEVEQTKQQIELEQHYFEQYWLSFHTVVTFVCHTFMEFQRKLVMLSFQKCISFAFNFELLLFSVSV